MLRRALPARLCTAALLAAHVGLAPLTASAQQTPPIPLHVVEPGETLWQIADRNGLDTATLMQLNGMENGDILYPGATLKLAAAVFAPAPRPTQPLQVHTVAEGDTLAGIAALYGVLVDTLVETNGIEDPNLVMIGAQLKVPGAAGAALEPAPSVPAAVPPAPQPVTVASGPSPASRRSLMSTYIVQPGETLNGVARQYGVDPQVVAQATGLENPNLIPVGAILKIPVPAREHTVVAGETLYRIAAMERVDLGALIDFNEIADPAMIRVGEVLVLPASPQLAATLPAPRPEPPPAPAPAPAPAAIAPPAPGPGSTATPSAPPSAPAPTPAPAPPKPVPVPPGTPTDGAVGQAIKLRGMPYVFGGSGPTSFDCSGFVWYVFKQVGKPVSRGLFSQYNSGPHPARDQLKPGDIVFFQNTYMPGLSHNGIYIGNGSFIHAADERSGVTISSLAAPYWASRWFGATRIP